MFTDDQTIRNWPDNVLRVFMTFDELKELIQSKFDFEIKIIEPHKLCDYKPAYGYISEEYLEEADYRDIAILIRYLEISISFYMIC